MDCDPLGCAMGLRATDYHWAGRVLSQAAAALCGTLALISSHLTPRPSWLLFCLTLWLCV